MHEHQKVTTDNAAARERAAAALAAWQNGTVTAAQVLPLLHPVVTDAADYSNLGAVLRALGHARDAEAAYRRAIALDPGFAAAHYNLGNLLFGSDRLPEAAAAFHAAVAAKDDYAEAWNGLGLVLQRQGELSLAAESFGVAAAHAPRWIEAQINLGVALLGLDRNDAAQRALKAAIDLDASHASAHGNLGALYLRAGLPIAAEIATKAALVRAPREHRWITNLAVALQLQARHAETDALYRQALSIRPDYASGHGNLLFALTYRHDLPPEAIFAEYRRWDALHARPLAQRAPVPDPLAGRRLRIGYVSPDFRQHAVALFAEPLMAAHDRAAVELFCYAEVPVEDSTTARFRTLTDHWRSTVGLDDAAVADMVRQDRIDVLVDLGGHTAGSRLLVFARRPAPVQIAWLLGHGYTTGLSAMDGFLADERLAPPGSDQFFSEPVIRLPRIPFAYAPPSDMPAVAPPPANGAITFGYFGRPERLNEAVISAWSRILHGVPDARLVLNNRGFQEPAFRDLFTTRFARHGITADRLDLIFTAPQPLTWAAYGTIDIALDPFPHNGGTTTIEALWQGVPVVTLADRPSVGRFGASILHAAALDDWVTTDVDAYVARAIAAAGDRDSLAALRFGLRERIASSPLLDAAALARCMEAAFHRMVQAILTAAERIRLEDLFRAGAHQEAAALAETMLARDPDDAAAAHVAGLLAYHASQFAKADALLQIAVRGATGDAEPLSNHAAVLRRLGRLDDAERAARAALAIAPNRAETQNNLGNILRDSGRYEESLICYKAAITVQPGFADAWANLSWIQSLIGHVSEAEHAARQAIAHDPRNANGHNNLGLALMRQSRLREAEATLREALRLKPDFALAHSNVLFCLNYRDDLTAEAIFAEYQEWDRRHAAALTPAEPAYELDRTPGRRLRVGYVSPDFRQHAVALFAEPLLAAHDKRAVELFCYAEVPVEDATTQRLRTLADHWRSTVGLDDAAVADMIRRDRIDVLVDLAGHTAGNRLLAFARKPAPVQVEFMLGHGYTSGLSAMDAFLADAALAPPGCEALFSERVIRLPAIPITYRPPDGMPAVAPLPALENGFVTFGYFGRTVRLNDAVISTWARILASVPNSRLMLNSAPFAEAAGRAAMTERFAAHGIAAERLVLICTAPQPRTWEAYGSVDIALDPFPHNAGTTTIEALWQGVPVVTLAGRPTVGRFGAAIMHPLGMDDWVATDTESYVQKAVAAAGNLEGMVALRADLRARFEASSLHDPAGLAAGIEAAYRRLWDEWRGAEAGELLRLYASGDRETARVRAEALAAQDPGHADALHVLGVLAYENGEPDRAIALLAQAVERADVLSDLGVMLRVRNRFQEAEQVYRRALAIDPDLAPALGNLGNVLLDLARPAEAEGAFARALTLAPAQPWLLRGQALALMGREAVVPAQALLRQALEIAPDDPEVHETLGALLGRAGRPIEAELHHRAALSGLAERHRALGNLGVVLNTQGRHAEAEDAFRQALALRPGYASGHSNLLFALNYRDDLPADAIFAEYRRWNARHAKSVTPLPPDWAPRGPRLRIGYVSPDFRQHAVALFAEPLLAAHDRTRVELFCYAEVAAEDSVTQRFRSIAEHWRSTVGMTDDAVAAMIRADGIDVLIDLAGHTGGSRLLAFARRPAPVQIEYILGHGYTSGLDAMDAFLADDALAPPGAGALFSERLIRLPRAPIAYQPPDGMPPVGPLPALANGHITFGYFGRPERLGPRVIAAWASILTLVRGSVLTLNSAPFQEVAFRELFAARFAAHGIAPERLSMIFTTPQQRTWEAYNTIDIALDPFPHNAGTTTIEALWQGVPVITQADRPGVGRFGASILRAVGLDGLVTASDADYAALTVRMASDLSLLSATRATLRQRVSESPLCDAPGLAAAVEAACETLLTSHLPPAAMPMAAE
jgi:predicted O-linked N-acetylglucosamine transferase (SPINDLY family)